VSELPGWRRSDLPHAPQFTLGNAVRVIGPGTILLGMSLGAGDWLLGPAVTVAGAVALTRAEPLALVVIGANLAAVNLAVIAFHTLSVNRTLLPRELRPPLWRQTALGVCGLFFACLAWAALGDPTRFLALLGW